MDLSSETLTLPFRDPFRIARAEDSRAATTVVVDVVMRGLEGVGEAYPTAYYGETTGTVGAVLPLLAEVVNALGDPPSGTDAARAWLVSAAAAMAARIGGHGSAKAALDIALHDLVARGMGIPVWQLIGTSSEVPPTDFTLGIDTPDEVAARARRAAHFPALKIKVGGPADLETLEAVRAVYGGTLRVDANTGWQPEEGAKLIPELVRLGVELIEQPFPAHQLAQLRWLQERCPLPVVADESAVWIHDLEGLVGVVQGVNVKIMKCGGIGPGLAMMRRAKELGFRVLLGCMEETSVAIAAAASLASLADWLDLDGNLLLGRDPFEGLELGPDSRWQLTDTPGLGVRRRSD